MQAQRNKVRDGKMTQKELEAYRNKLANGIENSNPNKHVGSEKAIQQKPGGSNEFFWSASY